MRVLDALGHALGVAGTMTWEITWSPMLGFTLWAVIQAHPPGQAELEPGQAECQNGVPWRCGRGQGMSRPVRRGRTAPPAMPSARDAAPAE